MTDRTILNISSIWIIALAMLFSASLFAQGGGGAQDETEQQQALLEQQAAMHQHARAQLKRQHEKLADARAEHHARMQQARQHAMAEREQAHQVRMLQVQNQQQAREQASQVREQAEQDREQARQHRERARADYESARAELRAAANKVAELSADLTPARGYAFRFLRDANRAMLGVSISDDDEQAGVRINSVSPGGPADQAGLQSKDILLAINDVRLDVDQLSSPASKVLEVMSGLEPGDEVSLEFQRDGVIDDAVLVAERRSPHSFAPIAPLAPLPDNAPLAPVAPNVFFSNLSGGFVGGLELVNINADLGRYFGTSDGLLVVSVPEDFPADVRSGDVLMGIDGREPGDPHHAFRILRSYDASETVTLEILRDRDEIEVSFEVPERSHPFKSLSMLKGHEVFKALEGLDLSGGFQIKGLEALREMDLEDLESLGLLKDFSGELGEALSNDFEVLMEDGFINGLHFEFSTGEDTVEPDVEFEWIEAEQDEDDSII